MQLVPPCDKPKGTVIDDVIFRRPSVSEQLRIMAARLESGEWPEPEHLVVVLGYDDPQQHMVCLPGGTKDGHPYFLAGMLQNASLTCLDDAAFQCEGLDDIPE